MKQKIYILSNTLKSGGAEKQSVLLTKALSEKYNTLLVVFDKELNCDVKLLTLVKDSNISVNYLHDNRFISILFFVKLIISQKPNIVFSYLAFTNTVNALLGKILRIRFRIGGIRNSFIPKSKFILQKYLHNYLLTALVSNSYSGKKSHLAGGYDKKSIFVIPNCYILTEKPLQRQNNNNIKILTVGRFVAQKDYITLLNSFQILLKKLKTITPAPIVKLVIIGYGEDENMMIKQIEELKISKSVEIIINPANLFDYYKNCDIYISTSLFEGLSNSIMEAMAYSLPIVATDVGDTNELVNDKQNGFLVPIKDYNTISEKLIELCNNHDLRIRMGQRSYELIREKFLFEVFRERYISLIEHEFKT